MPFGLTTPGGQPVSLLGNPAAIPRGNSPCICEVFCYPRFVAFNNDSRYPGPQFPGYLHVHGVLPFTAISERLAAPIARGQSSGCGQCASRQPRDLFGEPVTASPGRQCGTACIDNLPRAATSAPTRSSTECGSGSSVASCVAPMQRTRRADQNSGVHTRNQRHARPTALLGCL
jgi:hypothetical protein